MRLRTDRNPILRKYGSLPINWLPQPVENSAFQSRADTNLENVPRGDNYTAWPHSTNFTQWHEDCVLPFESNYLSLDPALRSKNIAELTHITPGAQCFNG